MAPSPCIELDANACEQLLHVARQSIQHCVEHGTALKPAVGELPPALATPLGVFVTLTLQGKLRGCIGSLHASDALARAVADAAHGAAFRDPRFAPLTAQELDQVHIDIAVLTPMQALVVSTRSELLEILRPQLDGLLLQDGAHRSTFLPKVWEQLPIPDRFLDQLLLKAGLPGDYWSNTLEFQRYQALSFGERL
jgi:AmmeMemoRadiSam system protein A